MSSSSSGGTAGDADVTTSDGDGARRQVTPAHADYLDAVAEDAENAVGLAEQTIADLKGSLADRKQAAKDARAEARDARKQMEG